MLQPKSLTSTKCAVMILLCLTLTLSLSAQNHGWEFSDEIASSRRGADRQNSYESASRTSTSKTPKKSVSTTKEKKTESAKPTTTKSESESTSKGADSAKTSSKTDDKKTDTAKSTTKASSDKKSTAKTEDKKTTSDKKTDNKSSSDKKTTAKTDDKKTTSDKKRTDDTSSDKKSETKSSDKTVKEEPNAPELTPVLEPPHEDTASEKVAATVGHAADVGKKGVTNLIKLPKSILGAASKELQGMGDGMISFIKTGYSQSGTASFYGNPWHGSRTANGEIYDMNSMTAAHPSLPFNTRVLVTNLRNGKKALVRINNRGPFSRGRIIDLSRAAASQIGMIGSGIAPVKLEVVKTH